MSEPLTRTLNFVCADRDMGTVSYRWSSAQQVREVVLDYVEWVQMGRPLRVTVTIEAVAD